MSTPLLLIAAFLGQPMTQDMALPLLSQSQPIADTRRSSIADGPLNPAELFALAGRAPCVPGIGFTVKDTWLGSSMMCTTRAEAEALDEAGKLQPAYECCGCV